MIFTDENGKEYEVHATMPTVNEEFLVIKPVPPPEPEKPKYLFEWVVRINPKDENTLLIHFTKDIDSNKKAQIGKTINDLMKWLTLDGERGHEDTVWDTAVKTRKMLKEPF